MDSSRAYYSDPLVFIIPAGEPFSAFEKLFSPFQTAVWALIMFVVLISVLVITGVKIKSKSLQLLIFGERNQSPFLNLLIVFYGGQMTKLPTKNFARLLLAIYMLYCLVGRNLYQGALFQFLQTEMVGPQVSSIDEMVKKDFSFYMLSTSQEYTQNMSLFKR